MVAFIFCLIFSVLFIAICYLSLNILFEVTYTTAIYNKEVLKENKEYNKKY